MNLKLALEEFHSSNACAGLSDFHAEVIINQGNA